VYGLSFWVFVWCKSWHQLIAERKNRRCHPLHGLRHTTTGRKRGISQLFFMSSTSMNLRKQIITSVCLVQCHHYIKNMDKTDETEQSNHHQCMSCIMSSLHHKYGLNWWNLTEQPSPVYVLYNVIITSQIWIKLMKLDRATITSVCLVQCHHYIANMD